MLWKTVTKSTIEGWRNDHEDDLLACFARLRPAHTKRATVLADRGFGDQKLYPFLVSLGLDFVIRFRGLIHVEAPDGQTRPAAEHDNWKMAQVRAEAVALLKRLG